MGGLIIAGDRSGAGKTTVTMALLATLRAQGNQAQAFKVGPDYIDPMFHRAITGRPAYNLDPVLTSEAYVQGCFQQHSAHTPYAVIEGVMGLFDGAGGTVFASTAHIAQLLGCPILLVVDCGRLSRSLAALVHGYRTLDARIHIAGVVLNRVGSDRHLAMLRAAMTSIAMPVMGVLRRDNAVTLPDRHLGLVPTDEVEDLPQRFQYLAALGQRCFDWSQLEPVFQIVAGPLPSPTAAAANLVAEPALGSTEPIVTGHDVVIRCFQPPGFQLPAPVRLGIARDRAFNFYYEDNLTALQAFGAELVPFSPLKDSYLPPNLHGLYLGGGFPEMFAAALSANQPLRQAIGQLIAAGLPTYAECGGLMYLCRELVDFDGRSWPMVGAIAAIATMTSTLTLGYRQITAQQTTPLLAPGQHCWGHEFHRSQLQPAPPRPLHQLQGYPIADQVAPVYASEGWGHATLHASYVHLHWGDQRQLPHQFLQRCYRRRKAVQSSTEQLSNP